MTGVGSEIDAGRSGSSESESEAVSEYSHQFGSLSELLRESLPLPAVSNYTVPSHTHSNIASNALRISDLPPYRNAVHISYSLSPTTHPPSSPSLASQALLVASSVPRPCSSAPSHKWWLLLTHQSTRQVSSTPPSTLRRSSRCLTSRSLVPSLVCLSSFPDCASQESKELISIILPEYAVDCIVETVDYAMGKPSTSARGRSSSRHSAHANFLNFVTNVITKAEVKVPVLLVALVYIDRAKPHLQIALEQWACERVFLGALILANKVSLSPTISPPAFYRTKSMC